MTTKDWIKQLCPEIADWQADLIAKEWHNELLEEREACAKLCEDRWQYGTATDCSQAIRARSGK